MQLDWSKLNMFSFCTFLESGATIEPNQKMQQLYQSFWPWEQIYSIASWIVLYFNSKAPASVGWQKWRRHHCKASSKPRCFCQGSNHHANLWGGVIARVVVLNSRPTCPTPLPRSTNVFPAISNLHSSKAIMRFVNEKRIANGNIPMSLDIREMRDSP